MMPPPFSITTVSLSAILPFRVTVSSAITIKPASRSFQQPSKRFGNVLRLHGALGDHLAQELAQLVLAALSQQTLDALEQLPQMTSVLGPVPRTFGILAGVLFLGDWLGFGIAVTVARRLARVEDPPGLGIVG